MSIRAFFNMRTGYILTIAILLSTWSTEATGEPTGYSDAARLTDRLRTLVKRSPETARLSEIGRTREGREVWVLELARTGDRPPDERTAILIVAGLDATHLVGTETAVELAKRLTAPPPVSKPTTAPAGDIEKKGSGETSTDILVEHTIYIVPRMNPDGAERFLGAIQEENDANTLPTDDDRDGVADDDPPDDLNGDGMITMMRVGDPEATHIADPDEPRLLRKADPAKGERPVFKVYAEGLDNDGDGEYNEDGIGGTILNRNFPHAYPELGAGAGRYHLSEPESLALARFVLDHPNIAAVLVYGLHDNMVKVPGDKARDISGRGYRHLHPDDTPVYQHLSERFKELTDLKGAAEHDDAGAFFGWTYNQRGLPTIATTLWWMPEEKNPEDAKKDKKANSQTATQPASQPTSSPSDETPTSQCTTSATTKPTSTAPAESPGKKSTPGGNGMKKKGKPGKDPLKIDKQWLKYSDTKRGGAGFVDWTPFEHPTLGTVEIGGFVPGFRINPPADEVAGIAQKQLAFVKDLAERLPKPRVADCKVTRKSDAIFEIELSMTNDAYLPTALGMAKTARVGFPFVLRLDLPAEDILGGRRVHRINSLGGLGATDKVRWLVRGRAGQNLTISIYHKRFGTIQHTVRLEQSDEGVQP
ncbi:MAG: M14 family metallopeptidase [Phycisphaerae bacterium]